VTILGITVGTVPGTVPRVVRSVVSMVVWKAILGPVFWAIATSILRPAWTGTRRPTWMTFCLLVGKVVARATATAIL